MKDKVPVNKIFPVIIAVLSSVIWLLSNINCPLRFTTEPMQFTNWHIIGLTAQIVSAAILFSVRKWRKFIFYPLLFGIYSAFYILMSVLLPIFINTDFASDFTLKIIHDLIYFTAETAVFLPMLLFLKNKNFLNIRLFHKNSSSDLSIPYNTQPKSVKYFMNISSALFIAGVFIIGFTYPFRIGITTEVFKQMLLFQLIFGLVIGIKDEIVFRWLLQQKLFSDTGSIIITILVQSIIWMSYHFFFGEGTGTGYFAAFMTLIAAAWWGYAAYIYKNLWLPFIGHIGIELFGFYLMYSPFI